MARHLHDNDHSTDFDSTAPGVVNPNDARWDPIPDDVWTLELGNAAASELGEELVGNAWDAADDAGEEETHFIPAGRVASAPAIGGVPSRAAHIRAASDDEETDADEVSTGDFEIGDASPEVSPSPASSRPHVADEVQGASPIAQDAAATELMGAASAGVAAVGASSASSDNDFEEAGAEGETLLIDAAQTVAAPGASRVPAAQPMWNEHPWGDGIAGVPDGGEHRIESPDPMNAVDSASVMDGTPASYGEEAPYAPLDHTVAGQQAWVGSRRAAAQGRDRVSRGAASSRSHSPAMVVDASGDEAASPRRRPTRVAGSEDTVRRRAPRAPKRAKHGCLSLFLWLIMLVVLAFMAVRCLPASYASGRALPELVSFMPLLFIPIIACLALSALWRRRLLLVVCILALGVMGWWHRGFFLPTARVSDAAQAAVATSATTDDTAARIMTLNTLNGNASAAEIVQICRDQHVEVLCLQELTDDMVNALYAAGIDEVLPYSVVSAGASSVSNGGRNGIWTLAPMSNISYNLLPIETSSMPAATIQIGARAVRIVSVHPNSPVRGAQDLWESGLSVIGSLSDYDHSYLIMGDFNSTWDHAHFRELLGDSFVDASEQAGEGFHMTYPSGGSLPSLVEIDHIVYARDSGIVVSDLETVAVSGSDHRALLGTLEAS